MEPIDDRIRDPGRFSSTALLSQADLSETQMPHRPWPGIRVVIAALALGVVLAAPSRAQAAPDTSVSPDVVSAPEPERPAVERHAGKVAEATVLAQQVLGPMPAIASTPFLGLSILAGAAVVSDTDAVRQSNHPWAVAFRDNALIREARQYSSWSLFAILLTLSVGVYLANTGKIRGTVGKLFRMTEDGSVWVLYGCLALATFVSHGWSAAAEPAVAKMGFLDVPQGILLTAAVSVSLAAMMALRFALDVLIWLSPVPLVDFAFETLKKVVSLGFMALYFWSPFAAATLSLLLAVFALFAYGWAHRLVRFDFDIILRPWLARLFPALQTRLVEPKLAERAAGGEVRLAVPGAVLAVTGLPKRQIGALLATGAGLSFTTTPLFRRARQVAFSGQGEGLTLYRTLGWIELQVARPNGKVDRIALPRTLMPEFTKLCALLGAQDGGALGIARLLDGFRAVPTPLAAGGA